MATYRRRGKTWTVILDDGRDAEGKRKQISKGGFRIKGDAERWYREQAGRLDRGEYVEPSRLTFGTYLLAWLAAIRHTVRASTWESYERSVRVHLVPRLGHIPLQRLGPEDLSRAYADLLRDGRVDGQGGLSPGSVRYLHRTIHRALRDAVDWGKVTRNAADSAKRPTGASKEMVTWTAQELAQFLSSLEGDPLQVPILLAATTGMRRGEVLGLRWSDVDLDQGRLSVRQILTAPRDPATGAHTLIFGEPKTARGKRSIKLDAQTVAALKVHRLEQEKVKRWGGQGWTGHGLVFWELETGQPIHPDHFAKRFLRRVTLAGLPRIRVHDLRHTYATLALRAGVHVKVVSSRLGHASIAITLETYSHVLPDLDEDAAEVVAAAIFGGGGQTADMRP
jgi:integrase